ncbi:MAG: FlgD immunoglobulin-like domain containing protein, partial [Candidatus Cloacimonetes bacterium]|nr:FlgD immunoglobulin-like domain containing protein [Candidatus Cloacimonadota bacterium]
QRAIKSHGDRFTVNSTGVRYIYLKVGGRDTRTWTGQYGTSFDENYVGINNSFDPSQPRTNPVTNISYISAQANGYMDALGIDNPTQHGHCWNTSGMPTIDDSKTTLGVNPRVAIFTSNLTGLSAETQYFVRSYATNSAGTAYGEEVSFTTAIGVANLSPENNAVDTAIRPEISWEADGITPSGYKLYLGTDNPPAELVYDGNLTSYQPENPLLYNQQYFWRVDPYIGEDSGQGDLWSFTTTDIYESGAVTGLVDIEPVVSLPNVNGNFAPDISTGLELPDAPFGNDGLYIIISGVPMNGRLVVINPDLGFAPQNVAYRIEPSLEWQIVPAEADWTATYVYFTVMEAKMDGDLIILFPDSEDSTLPVELSSFAAVLTAENLVELTWTAQSETNLSGYKVYRHDSEVFALSTLISQLIPAQNSSTVQNYHFKDSEFLEAGTYYYWLESLDLDGLSNYYGPIQLLVETNYPEINPPELPRTTALLSAYPNPFNPLTSLPYQLEKGADVRMDVFNSKGQLVRSFQASHPQGGIYNFYWDGRDQDGRAVTSGIYFYHMSSGNYKAARKVVLMK